VFPVENAEHIHYLRYQMLETQLKDNVRARVMQEDGTYVRRKPPSEDKAVDVQEFFMNNHRGKKS
jgi:polyphosphate kinase